MRQPSIILTILFILLFSILPAISAIRGGIDYTIPIDYDKLSEEELVLKGKVYFYNAIQVAEGKLSEDVTNALIIYSILQKKNPTNISYCIKRGVLYDKLKKDRFAKGDFSKAIGINSLDPEAYFYFGEFYYKREMYRKALKYYLKAYDKGYNTNYDTLYKLGDIYEKLGDTRLALKYLKEATVQSPNSGIESKIKHVEAKNAINTQYYKD